MHLHPPRLLCTLYTFGEMYCSPTFHRRVLGIVKQRRCIRCKVMGEYSEARPSGKVHSMDLQVRCSTPLRCAARRCISLLLYTCTCMYTFGMKWCGGAYADALHCKEGASDVKKKDVDCKAQQMSWD